MLVGPYATRFPVTATLAVRCGDHAVRSDLDAAAQAGALGDHGGRVHRYSCRPRLRRGGGGAKAAVSKLQPAPADETPLAALQASHERAQVAQRREDGHVPGAQYGEG